MSANSELVLSQYANLTASHTVVADAYAFTEAVEYAYAPYFNFFTYFWYLDRATDTLVRKRTQDAGWFNYQYDNGDYFYYDYPTPPGLDTRPFETYMYVESNSAPHSVIAPACAAIDPSTATVLWCGAATPDAFGFGHAFCNTRFLPNGNAFLTSGQGMYVISSVGAVVASVKYRTADTSGQYPINHIYSFYPHSNSEVYAVTSNNNGYTTTPCVYVMKLSISGSAISVAACKKITHASFISGAATATWHIGSWNDGYHVYALNTDGVTTGPILVVLDDNLNFYKAFRFDVDIYNDYYAVTYGIGMNGGEPVIYATAYNVDYTVDLYVIQREAGVVFGYAAEFYTVALLANGERYVSDATPVWRAKFGQSGRAIYRSKSHFLPDDYVLQEGVAYSDGFVVYRDETETDFEYVSLRPKTVTMSAVLVGEFTFADGASDAALSIGGAAPTWLSKTPPVLQNTDPASIYYEVRSHENGHFFTNKDGCTETEWQIV